MNVLGIDGCKAGWCYYRIHDAHHSFGVVNKLQDLLENISVAEQVFIDMPIGLLDEGPEERICDLEARKALSKGRASSVFRVPVRDAIYAGGYEEASRINYERTGKKLSRQSWNISTKIRELDKLLNGQPELIELIHESHPELCFEGLAGHGLQFRKAVREGFYERLSLLRKLNPLVETVIADAWLNHGGYELKRDDILDACALALSAQHYSDCRCLPEKPPVDTRGLPMQIMYYSSKWPDVTR
jgi:predicted RNase H-like nuclease